MILPRASGFARDGALMGLGCGVLYSFGGFVIDMLTTGLHLGSALAFGALVGMPVILAAAGFVLGAIIALGGPSPETALNPPGTIERLIAL